MKAQIVSSPQHTATDPTWPPARRTVRAICPECGNPGPHRDLSEGAAECGNYYRTRTRTRTPTGRYTWRPCGASWQYSVGPFVPEDGFVQRVTKILDETAIAVVDTSTGETLLTWDCTLEIARTIGVAMPIEGLDLTVRFYNCLKRVGIDTVGDLVSRSEPDLLGIRGLGVRTFDEVKLRLAGLGLQLRAAAIGEANEEIAGGRVTTLGECLGGAA